MRHFEHERLADYWLGDVSPEDEAAIEEHLFECSQCSDALGWIARFGEALKAAARQGNVGMLVTPEFVERLVREGFRVRTYAPPSGGEVQCTVTKADDLLMGQLRADLSSARRIDAVVSSESGTMNFRIEDVPFRAVAESELVWNQPMAMARASGKDVMVIRLVEATEGDRVLAEYTFRHSPPVG
jgi:hypothetical protein